MDVLNLRVIEVMQRVGVSKTNFAIDLEISQAMVTHIYSGRNKPGVEVLQKIITAYPKIDAEWLLTGKGQIEKKPEKDVSQLKNSLLETEKMLQGTATSITEARTMLRDLAEKLNQ